MIRPYDIGLSMAISWLLLGQPAVNGAEPNSWADPALRVRDGLVLWLDATVQSAARQAQGQPALASEDPLAVWLDAFGTNRHLRQTETASQPRLILVHDRGLVSFDGAAAHLSLEGLGQQFDELTVFVVAAPYSNDGYFRGLISLRAARANDYQTGLNIDQGPFPSSRFETVNVEGAGFGGAQNLSTSPSDFFRLRRMCLTSAVGENGVALWMDGKPNGKRGRSESKIRMDQVVVGARVYGETDAPKGFFAGAIAEIILYDRVLSESQRVAVDNYLAAKYAAVETVPVPRGFAQSIERVADPPALQMHVPGFTVRELPLELPNINNVQYRPDGKLMALAYNGNVYLLTDSNGDGLEDHAQLFWENTGDIRSPIGMDLTPPGYSRGQGLFVATKSNCVLIADSDGDGQAEEPIVIATGWPESIHQVDALGVAVDSRDQSIYFGLGTTNFADAYVKSPDGTANYSLSGEKGTIMRVAPDFKSREIVATGIRFPVAMRFNSLRDLFCTDQEGATWLANGNPFDELLHIEKGRHYGFPPRHPRHLPNVIDEPSVFDYRPQHQSTCGLNFNELTLDGTTFGPEWWRGDALVTGYSRGKLYRTKLVRTASGYVAQNQLIGTMRMMPSDACVAPDHSLVVAAHSGGPDWGSGPGGMGKLYKVRHAERKAPAPTAVWVQTPHEVRIAFDQPLDPSALKDLAARIVIQGSEFADAAERFESFRPGYAVVDRQQHTKRTSVEVYNVQLAADRRTLILSTSPHSAAKTYAIALPALVRTAEPQGGQLKQLPDVDVQYDLCGVEAEWQPAGNSTAWQGWLPHIDTDVARAFTQRSAAHDELWKQLADGGTLRLSTSLNLRDMLRPAIQPGESIDYEFPPEEVTVVLNSNCPLESELDGRSAKSEPIKGRFQTRFTVPHAPDAFRHMLEVRVKHAADGPPLSLSIHYFTNEDKRPRALPLTRFLLPWSKPSDASVELADNRRLPELKGGNWLRGRAEFFGEQAGCSKCHQMHGEGAQIGPNLSNLPHRDYHSVFRDIAQPSFALNPDHTTQVFVLASGRVLTGTSRVANGQMYVVQQDAKEIAIDRDEIDSVVPSSESIMPAGIPELLGPDRLRDLLMFLLVEPPHMPVYGEAAPPPPRSIDEVQAILSGSATSLDAKPLHVVLVSGAKDHGPGEHDYPAWQRVWKQLFEMDKSVRVTTADPWPVPADFESADVMVFYQKGDWTADRARDIDAFLRRGGGLVYIHYAVDGGNDAPGFAQRIGLAWRGGHSKFRHGPLDVQFTDSTHPIARNFDHVHFHDESYWNLLGNPQRIRLLATGFEEGNPQPLFWTTEQNDGRVFVSIPGHFSWTFDDPVFRVLLLRGLAWAADEPVDRFNDLVTPGARIAPR